MVAGLGVDREHALARRQLVGAEPHVVGGLHVAVDHPAQRVRRLVDAQHAALLAARVERAELRLDVVHRLVRRLVGHAVEPVQRALVDLTGDRDLALGLEPADRLDRGRVVAPGDVAEEPLDRHQPRLQVAHLLAGGAPGQQRRSGVQDVEELVVGRLPGHGDQPLPGAPVDDAGGLQAALGLEAAHGLAGDGAVAGRRQLGEPGELEEPGLELPHLHAAVAGGEHRAARLARLLRDRVGQRLVAVRLVGRGLDRGRGLLDRFARSLGGAPGGLGGEHAGAVRRSAGEADDEHGDQQRLEQAHRVLRGR